MSDVLKNLEPKNVFYFFEEICNIPHGSGNVEKISNYLVNFAKERNLEVYQDEMKNVIIIKELFRFSHKDTVVKLSLEISNVAILQKSVTVLQKPVAILQKQYSLFVHIFFIYY